LINSNCFIYLQYEVKKLTTIFFLSIYLFSTTELVELLKIPVVFEHFAEHQKNDQSISIFQFLAIHYLHGSPKDSDYDRDMQLPFKTTTENCFSIVSPYIPLIEPFSIPCPIAKVTKQAIIFPRQNVKSSYLANIWQPPKFC
jgi:hypothetical protein